MTMMAWGGILVFSGVAVGINPGAAAAAAAPKAAGSRKDARDKWLLLLLTLTSLSPRSR
jgi:hypothetical protein